MKRVILLLLWGVIFCSHPSAHAQTLLREYWLNAAGGAVTDLTGLPTYPEKPSGNDYIGIFEGPLDWAENYGTRVRGYVLPPANGTYTFWISGDDQSQLFLSTDEDPLHKRQIAYIPTWTGSRVWEETRDGINLLQKSDPIPLQAGRRYYVEVLQKEGGGGDHLAVGWQLPDGSLERPIPGQVTEGTWPGVRLQPWQPNTNPPSFLLQLSDLTVEEGNNVTLNLSLSGGTPMYYTWYRNGAPVIGEMDGTFDLGLMARSQSGTQVYCVVSNAFGRVTSRTALVTVVAETKVPVVASLSPPAGSTVRQLDRIEVLFSEPVTGVTAEDLLINGRVATRVSGFSAGPYLFEFTPITAQSAQLSWAAGHGIRDLSSHSNGFGGGTWSYVINPSVALPLVVISEIATANESGLVDEEGEAQDWIELHNRGSSPVNLAGWSLSDSDNNPGQWLFPNRILGAGQFLVVFASGKDRRPAAADGQLHTNFKLNPDGEFLALWNQELPRQALSSFSPSYPGQRTDYSYGTATNGVLTYFSSPTPGRLNGGSSITGLVESVRFSVKRGFFHNPFNLVLSTPTPGAVIRYTLNGSEPSESNGLIYTNLLSIFQTTLMRAAAFKAGHLPSTSVTHTYLLGLDASRRSLPVMSLVTASNHLQGRTGILGISGGTFANGTWRALTTNDYHNPSQHGFSWERHVSVELIRPQDNGGFASMSGLRVQGSDYTRPRYDANSKFSYRLYFRGDYGTGKLDYPLYGTSPVHTFDQVVLRAGHNDISNPFIIDELSRRLLLATGQVSAHGTFVNLFINGQYKGYYNPTERVDKNFCHAWLGGGEEWDVIAQLNDALDGDTVAWTALRQLMASGNMTAAANYQAASAQLEMTNFVDYLLVNIYGATADWPGNNWRSARERRPGAQFRFIMWDAEGAFGTFGQPVSQDTFQTALLNAGSGAEIPLFYQSLSRSEEFRILFADRIHRHFFNKGALTDAAVEAQFRSLEKQLAGVIPAMSQNIPTSWIPQRRGFIMQHFGVNGLLRSDNAPGLGQHGGNVPLGFRLSMTNKTGTVYYTTNGQDPRVAFTGAVSPSATACLANQMPTLNGSVTVKARSLNGTLWSALTEADFLVNELGTSLRISEIMFNPPGGDVYEFVELFNSGGSGVDLGGMSFSGIQYTFQEGARLEAGQTLVLSSSLNSALFSARYPGVVVRGSFGGTLSNNGERLGLKDRNGRFLITVDYKDSGTWPAAADGQGAALELEQWNGDPDEPATWKASVSGGTPGTIPPAAISPKIRLNEVMADNQAAVVHGGIYPDWVELYNEGSQVAHLGGWKLMNGDRSFVFPTPTDLAAGGYLLVWCDGVTNTLELHASFSLGRKGESLLLLDSSGNRVDALTFGAQLTDYTVGRFDGSWRLNQPTPGRANQATPVAASSNLWINEWMANPLSGSGWIELFNRDLQLPLALQGFYLGSSGALQRLGSLSFLAPGGFLVLSASEDPGSDQLDFKLAPSGGDITLSDSTGNQLQKILHPAMQPGTSLGSYPDGIESRFSFFTTVSRGAPNYPPLATGLVLSEVMAINTSSFTNQFGDYAGWMELRNRSTNSTDLSGLSLSVGESQPGQWTFPQGLVMAPESFLVIWCDPTRPASLSLTNYLNVGRALGERSGGVYLFQSTGELVDVLEYGLQIDRFSMGRAGTGWGLTAFPTPGGGNASEANPGVLTNLRFNEWMTHPLRGGDWFEIYNPNPQPAPLGGLYLTDDPSVAGITRFQIPKYSYLAPKSFIKWEADGRPDKGVDHAPFRLDGQSGALRLYTRTQAYIDGVNMGGQAQGVSMGRLPDGADSIVAFPGSASPGEGNFLAVPDLWINEVLASTDAGTETAVEFFNPSSQVQQMGNWFLSDSVGNLKKWKLPAGTQVLPGQFRVLYQSDFAVPGPVLAGGGGSVMVSESDGAGNLSGRRVVARYGACEPGTSFGRWNTSVGTEFVALSRTTFGNDQAGSIAQFRLGKGASNAVPRLGPVVIRSLFYAPAAAQVEFVQLQNLSPAPVRLWDSQTPTRTWRLAQGIEFVFPPQTVMEPLGGILVVPFDPVHSPNLLSAFRQAHGLSATVPVLGPFQGQLANEGETVQLLRPTSALIQSPLAEIVVDEVSYGVETPWPVMEPGLALERIGPLLLGNDSAGWITAMPHPGQVTAMADEDQDGMPDWWELAHGLDPRRAQDGDEDADGDLVSNRAEFQRGTDALDGADGFGLQAVFPTAAGGVRLRFQALAGRSYQVQTRETVESSPWQLWTQVSPEPLTHRVDLEIPVVVGQSGRLYRLVLVR